MVIMNAEIERVRIRLELEFNEKSRQMFKEKVHRDSENKFRNFGRES